MHRLALAALTLGLVAACATPPQGAADASAGGGSQDGRATIETASMAVEVEAVAPAADAVRSQAVARGGRVVASDIWEKHAVVRVRVPARELSTLIASVGDLGDVKSRSTSSEDVTDTLTDLGAELENLRALRDRLRALLERAKTVEEVLEVERELTRVQTRIDSLQGRLQRLEGDVALAALTIDLREKPPRRVLGPLGLVLHGAFWLVEKLFVISP